MIFQSTVEAQKWMNNFLKPVDQVEEKKKTTSSGIFGEFPEIVTSIKKTLGSISPQTTYGEVVRKIEGVVETYPFLQPLMENITEGNSDVSADTTLIDVPGGINHMAKFSEFCKLLLEGMAAFEQCEMQKVKESILSIKGLWAETSVAETHFGDEEVEETTSPK